MTARHLRQQYHLGPGRIADYLKRFHGLTVARSTVHRILSKHGMNRGAVSPTLARFVDTLSRRQVNEAGHSQ